MSRFVRHLLCTTLAISAGASGAGAQLLGQLALPPVASGPIGNLPVAGSVLQDVLGSTEVQQQVVRPTLDRVQGLPQAVADAGPSVLADLRKMRLAELIRENRDMLEADDRGQPARRGVLIALHGSARVAATPQDSGSAPLTGSRRTGSRRREP